MKRKKASIVVGLLLALIILPGFTCSFPEQTQQLEDSIKLETERQGETTRQQDAIVLAIADINARLDSLPGDDPLRGILVAQVTALDEETYRLAGVIEAQNAAIGTQTAELELLKSAQGDPLGTVVDAASPFVPAPWREVVGGILGLIGVIQTVRHRNEAIRANIAAADAERFHDGFNRATNTAMESGLQFDRLVKNIEAAKIPEPNNLSDGTNIRPVNFNVLGAMNEAAGIQDLVTKARPAKPAA